MAPLRYYTDLVIAIVLKKDLTRLAGRSTDGPMQFMRMRTFT